MKPKTGRKKKKAQPPIRCGRCLLSCVFVLAKDFDQFLDGLATHGTLTDGGGALVARLEVATRAKHLQKTEKEKRRTENLKDDNDDN